MLLDRIKATVLGLELVEPDRSLSVAVVSEDHASFPLNALYANGCRGWNLIRRAEQCMSDVRTDDADPRPTVQSVNSYFQIPNGNGWNAGVEAFRRAPPLVSLRDT